MERERETEKEGRVTQAMSFLLTEGKLESERERDCGD